MKYIKIWGEKRTCTNIAQWVINNNFKDVEVLVNELGWKHKPINEVNWKMRNWKSPQGFGKPIVTKKQLEVLCQLYKNNEIFYILCSKDPIAWYVSFCRYMKVEMFPINKNYIDRFNDKYSQWINQFKENPDNWFLFRHESCLGDFPSMMKQIQEKFDLVNKNKLYIIPQNKMGKGGGYTKLKFDRRFYIHGDYINLYTQDQLRQLKALLNTNIIHFMQYD